MKLWLTIIKERQGDWLTALREKENGAVSVTPTLFWSLPIRSEHAQLQKREWRVNFWRSNEGPRTDRHA